ncbi:hypothetical protein [Paenibacillus ehimensis]|uniref:Uncharacterized protein n=1 Tax=Paenibacillus ehimensis TaxID=79264 RepID=A0ABT8VDT9_9BACL|nr:hypothetical protein [Paenibacillus ehimensis]MDO3679158.1 hypothetical protein [Paenibacillus ehimensis]MEC0207727.1 hypothetical protein [Paenibacillus ehimensis]
MFKRFGIAVVVVAIFFGLALVPQVEAGYGHVFKTGDGKWDGNVKTTSTYNMAEVVLYNLKPNVKASTLKVRLCSRSTGNCTNYKTVGDFEGAYLVSFSYLKPATYDVDVAYTGSGSVSGKLDAIAGREIQKN